MDRINYDLKLDSILIHDSIYSDDGGLEIKAYHRSKRIYKLQVEVGLSYSFNKYTLYYEEGYLFLIQEEENSYTWLEEESRFNYSEFGSTFKGSYFFDKKELIDYITIGHNQFEDGELDMEAILLKESKSYFDLAKKAIQAELKN